MSPEIDHLFPLACRGDEVAFERWMAEVEPQLWRSLAPWARAVDVEGVVQETLLRMWIFARDRGETLEGPNASLRFALGMARNVARSEARRFGREVPTPEGDPPEPAMPEPPLPDPALRQILRHCLGLLPPRPREALLRRIDRGPYEDDGSLAASLGMKRNTFLQNIVRARKHLERCLEEHGAPLDEVLPS